MLRATKSTSTPPPTAASPGMSPTRSPKGVIRHVHNIVHDAWGDCLWILTGDYGDECRILRASCDLQQVDVVLARKSAGPRGSAGSRRRRTLFLLRHAAGSELHLPLESSRRIARSSPVSPVPPSTDAACATASFFSTMVEPSDVNSDDHVRIYGSRDGENWPALLSWRKTAGRCVSSNTATRSFPTARTKQISWP